MKKIFLLFLLLCFCLPTWAANWVEIGYKQYVDTSSIKRQYKYGYNSKYSPNFSYAWIKTLNQEPTKKLKNKKIWFSQDYFVFDCESKRIKIEDSVFYDLDGNVIESYNVPTEWERVIPDSKGEQLFNAMCCSPKFFETKYIKKEDWQKIKEDHYINLNSLDWAEDINSFSIVLRVYKNDTNSLWFKSLSKKINYADVLLFFSIKKASVFVLQVTGFDKDEIKIYENSNLYKDSFDISENKFLSRDILKYLLEEYEKAIEYQDSKKK